MSELEAFLSDVPPEDWLIFDDQLNQGYEKTILIESLNEPSPISRLISRILSLFKVRL